MNPLRYPVVAFQFVSHRVLRWTITPFCMVALLLLNAIIVWKGGDTLYQVLLIMQLLFYIAAFMGWYQASRGKKSKLFNIPYYFVFMNLHVFRGISYLRTHQHSGTWEKAKRG
jgi:energy-coupling factor transporter transmembrane protein EcfT